MWNVFSPQSLTKMGCFLHIICIKCPAGPLYYGVVSVVSVSLLHIFVFVCVFVRRPTNSASSCPVAQPGSDPAITTAPVEVAQVCLSPPHEPHITPSVRPTFKVRLWCIHVYCMYTCITYLPLQTRWFPTVGLILRQPVWLKAAHPSQPKRDAASVQEKCSSPSSYPTSAGLLRWNICSFCSVFLDKKE